jgi:hypothetical protein
VTDELGRTTFKDDQVTDTSLETLLREDKKFGFLKPTNGVLTFKALMGDRELPQHIVEYLAMVALQGWSFETPIKFRIVKSDAWADLRLKFTDPRHDPDMTGMTLAYHYYPFITTKEKRGLCVFNTDYYYTIHGKPISLHQIDPVHYPKPDESRKGATFDFDRIYRHELGHGIFGLIHDGQSGNTMSANYSHGSDEITKRDYTRAQAKAGKRSWSSDILYNKIRKWYYTQKAANIPEEILA